MISNADIQKWQTATNAINELGQTDLSNEEWSALMVLNDSLQSGNFVSEECGRSYQVLNDNLDRHENNPDLQAHLFDFITLCYKYATAQQGLTVQETPTITENLPTANENKPSVTLKNILFGADGQFKPTLLKNLKHAIIYVLFASALAVFVYVLSTASKINMPGYVTALVVGALVSVAVLRKNQNGALREKLAFLGALVAGIWIYSVQGGQISGGYSFAWTFLGVGLILSFIGKDKPKLLIWLAEVIPAVLCFLAFERLGGAISGFGAKEILWGEMASVRYVEALKIFLWFCLFQSFADNAIATQYRKPVRSKWTGSLYALSVVVVSLLLCVFLNPFKLSVMDSYKSKLTTFSQPMRAGADVFDVNGRKIGSAEITPRITPLLSKHIPGYLATAYEFHYDGDFDRASITFKLDAGMGKIGNRFQPRIYYFNESDGTLEELPDQKVISDYAGWSSVIAKTEHFSTYILLNKVDFDAVWNTEIRKPPVTDDCSCGFSAAMPNKDENFDVVFVIDESGSMTQNDPNRLRVEAAKQFVDMMSADSPQNRAAIFGFTTTARTIHNLTALHDKEAVKTSLNSILSNGGTDIYRGLEAAVREIEEKNNISYSPIIVLMTDGQDNYKFTDYMPLIDRANAKGVTIFAIGLGSDVNATLLRQICDNTGGGVYYYAENAGALPFIFKSAKTAIIEYEKDSNGDGISDYYAQLLYDGTLRLSNGSAQFKGAEFLISNKADFDGDGYLNGEELVVTSKIINGVEQVCVILHSDPTDKNSIPSTANSVYTRLLASFAKASYDDEGEDLYFKFGFPVVVGTCPEWKLVYTENRPSITNFGKTITDFWYQIYENETENSIVVAFRGTPEPSLETLSNWEETIQLIFNSTHPQDEMVTVAVKNRIQEYAGIKVIKGTHGKSQIFGQGKKIYLTGHSLGGHLALIAYLRICQEGYENFVGGVETFNAVGISKSDNVKISKYGTDKIINHYTCCDIAREFSMFVLAFPGKSKEEKILHKNRCAKTGTERSFEVIKKLIIQGNAWSEIPEIVKDFSIRIDAHDMKYFNYCKVSSTVSGPILRAGQ